MPRSLARLSASELSHRDLFSVAFITNIAESDFWYTHPPKMADRPYQTAEIIPYGTERRLPDDAKRAFVEVVSTHTATHFKPSDLTVLCRYCELVVLAERAAFELSRNGVVLPDGTLSKWFGVHASTTKQIGVLAARLKIGPSTREKRQSKKTPAPVSVYDQIRNRKDWP
jgi:hypothetical protein